MSDQQTVESQPEPMSQPKTQSYKLALPIASLAVRVGTFVFLLVALIVIASDTASTINGDGDIVTNRFDDISAYRYVLSVIVLGLAYTFLLIPFAIIHIVREKPLFKHKGFLLFDFIGDKVVSSLLATGVGAGFGATLDLKSKLDELFQDSDYNEIRSPLDKYFDLASVSTAFLLLAFLCSIVSSVLSTLSLFKKWYMNELLK